MAIVKKLTVRRPPVPKAAAAQVAVFDPEDPLARQRQYVAEQDEAGGDKGFGLVFADAFIRGMREIGYKNPAWAIAELIDNSFQAGAKSVEVRLEDRPWAADQSASPRIAIIDDGIGMISRMIRHAVRWGGTDRENDRSGFGRYGYGLPSAAVSLARRYSVYSKTAGKKWYVVEVDLDKLGQAASDTVRVDELLQPRLAELPHWLNGTAGNILVPELKSGTIVVLEDADRLRTISGWNSVKALKMKLLQHFGVIYRHTLQNKKIWVGDERTEIIDPLFLLPKARYADETGIAAKKVEAAAFEMESSVGTGVVRIRASVLPPNFQLADPRQYGIKGAKLSQRHQIMRNNNGILVCRAGRQIDVVTPPWTRFQTYDANIKIEVDFDPTLDEFFGLTTSKQQIVVDENMWEKLKQSGKASGGLQTLIKEMRQEFRRMKAELEESRPPNEQDGGPRPSVAAIERAQKFKTRSSAISPLKVAAAERELKAYARIIAEAESISEKAALAMLRNDTAARPFQIEFKAMEEGPFYLARRLGLQKRLSVNTSHPFYSKVYELAGEARPGLEVLMFVLADLELDAEGDREEFYKSERKNWSEGLRHALDQLVSDQAMTDRASADAEAE